MEESKVEKLRKRLTLLQSKMNNSYNNIEKAELSDEIKAIKKEIAKIENSGKKKPELKSNISAPIIGDRKESRNTAFGRQIVPNQNNDSFISMI